VFAELTSQRSFEPSSDLYERFLEACAPTRRRERGVYFTPPEVVRAQVRLVDDLLRHRIGCADGFADPRVGIIDPATGGGAYPLAVLDHISPADADDVRARMWLFETQPGAAALARRQGLPVIERDALSTTLDLDAPIVVCLGNPPYRRRTATAESRTLLAEIEDRASGVHRKNLYNEYVYFWRWGLGVTCERRAGPAVVCFVTAASYLRGPAFGGLRRLIREELDELWLIDLEGDQLAARVTQNVFAIRTPIVIALGVRYARTAGPAPAEVHYARLGGGASEKLAQLDSMRSVADVKWASASTEFGESLTALRRSAYSGWPALTELFPVQLSGAQLKRTWPIGISPEVLHTRWRQLLALPPAQQRQAFVPTRDRDLDSTPPDLFDSTRRLERLRDLPKESPCIEPVRYAYRAFDRQWVLPDARCGDFMRPSLWRINGPRQVFLTSMLTNVLGPGPAAVATAQVPDLDHFRGSFGARGVIPLWRDAAASQPNVSGRWLVDLSERFGFEVLPEALMAYCYALLATPTYTRRFSEELRTPGPRVPLTPDAVLFRRSVVLGQALMRLHTYREVPVGRARVVSPIGDAFPASYGHDAAREQVSVGNGLVGPVSPAVWCFSVSGYRVVASWLRRRLSRTGKSPLDAIRPTVWTDALTQEFLELLWLVEATLAHQSELDALLEEVVSGGSVQRPVISSEQVHQHVGPQWAGEDEALATVAPELLQSIPL